MTPQQRARLERIARRRSVSVGAVVRAAVDVYAGDEEPGDDLEDLFALELPVSDWGETKREIIGGATS